MRCEFAFAKDRPGRVSSLRVEIALPTGFPEERRPSFLAVVEHCTVHNSIRQAPDVRVEVSEAREAA